MIGPEIADLDYLERFLTEGSLAPDATLIVWNAGLILSGRSVEFAFREVEKHAALDRAFASGARLVVLPLLACMSRVTDRGLKFTDAMNGVRSPAHSPLSFFDQERVAIWWSRELPPFFASIPESWLPAMPEFDRPTPEIAASDSGEEGRG